jgi:hypothetical protein
LASSVESIADLNHSDLCVLLCGSPFPAVVRDFAQEIPKIVEWPSRNIDNYFFKFCDQRLTPTNRQDSSFIDSPLILQSAWGLRQVALLQLEDAMRFRL